MHVRLSHPFRSIELVVHPCHRKLPPMIKGEHFVRGPLGTGPCNLFDRDAPGIRSSLFDIFIPGESEKSSVSRSRISSIVERLFEFRKCGFYYEY